METLIWLAMIGGIIYLVRRYKRARWVLGILTLVIVLGAGGGFYYTEVWEKRPRVLTELWGLRLGMDRDDVLFRKGRPDKQTIEGSVEKLFFREEYSDETEGMVLLEDGQVVRVCLFDESRERLPFGLWRSSTVEDIQQRLGSPSSIEKYDGGARRRVYYRQYDVLFDLRKNRITAWAIWSK
jgi:hypothetical protein